MLAKGNGSVSTLRELSVGLHSSRRVVVTLINRIRRRIASILHEQSKERQGSFRWGFIETVKKNSLAREGEYRLTTKQVRVTGRMQMA